MDLNTLFLFIMCCFVTLVFILVIITLYEFIKLDKKQFNFYIIGLIFYCVSVICFFVFYIVLPPISFIENLVFGTSTYTSPLIGILFFIKGTEKIAKQLNEDFKKNETLHKLILNLTIITCITIIAQPPALVISETFYMAILLPSYVLYFVIVFLALKLLLAYKKFLGGIFSNIIFQYTIAVILLVTGGLCLGLTLIPVEMGNRTFTELSFVRKSMTLLAGFIIAMPFIICYRSVSKFRKLLYG